MLSEDGFTFAMFQFARLKFARFKDALCDICTRLFKERELLLRTEGEVRFIHLSPKMQAAICASVLAFTLWSGGTTILSWAQHVDLNDTAAEIVEAKLSYGNLRREVDHFETRMTDLKSRMLELIENNGNSSTAALKNEIKEFGGIGTQLRLAVTQLSTDLDLPEEEKHQIIRSRESLHDQIRWLEGHIDYANLRAENLRADIANLNGDVRDNINLKDQVVKERDGLLASVAKLEDQLDDKEAERQNLAETIIDLEGDLAERDSIIVALDLKDTELRTQLSGLEGDFEELTDEHTGALHRVALAAKRLMNTDENPDLAVANASQYIAENDNLTRLEHQIKRVVTDLSKAREEKLTMDAAMDTVLDGLERVAGFDRSLEDVEGEDTEQVLSLLDQIEDLHDTQFDMVIRLNAQANANITQVEKLIRTTGIDPEEMLRISGLSIGQGGPMVESDFVPGSAENLEIEVSALEDKVMRWERLKKIAKCIPMVAPVDHYNLTSKFGKRKDPFTGKPAIHKGIDLGGWPGTSVWSTAPGKVTFAGHSGQFGKMVKIDHGCGITTIYGHLMEALVKKGQEVGHRYKIGTLGNSGRSTGPHVHFEVRIEGQAVDPARFIEAGRHVFKS